MTLEPVKFPGAVARREHSGLADLLNQIVEHVKIGGFEQLDFLVSENQLAVVNRMEYTLKKNGQKVSFPRFIQVWAFDVAGKVEREFNSYDPTELLAAWRREQSVGM